jgi:iron complex transport system permease protein
MKLRIAIAVGLSLAVAAVCPLIGPAMPEGSADFILWQLRVPRTLMAIAVGGTLSLVGGVYQALFANPLAAPSTVGTTAGASLGALVAIALGARAAVWGLPLIVVAAFTGALGVSIVVAAIASRSSMRMNDIVLAGIACSLAAGAVSTGLQYSVDSAAMLAAVQWSLGHLPQVGFRGVLLLAPLAAVAVAGLLGLTRALDALVGGDERAQSQGVNLRWTRTAAIGFGALGVGACVAWCGPIAFIELIVPHLVRRVVGSSLRRVLPLSVLVGASFLVVCDTASRTLFPGREIPVGLITAALGAPLLVSLVARSPR